MFDLPGSSDTIKNENGSDCGGSEISLDQALAGVVQRRVRRSRRQARRRDAAGAGREVRLQRRHPRRAARPPRASSPTPTTSTSHSTALSAIGQYDVAATPLQMAMVGAGIANGGAVMKPVHRAEGARSPTTSRCSTRPSPEVLHQAISGSVADELTQMMVDVVENGTGIERPDPGRLRRRQDRDRELRRGPGRPTPGWSRSRRPTTRRSRSPCSSSRPVSVVARSAATAWPVPSPVE